MVSKTSPPQKVGPVRERRAGFGKRHVRMAKTALISGITGQDGSFLAELLLDKGYDVYGIIRRSSSFNTDRIDHLYQDPHEKGTRLHLVYGDLNDSSSLNTILRQIHPDEIYNLGAQSHVRVSFDIPEYTGEVTGLGTVRLLEAVREAGLGLRTRLCRSHVDDAQYRSRGRLRDRHRRDAFSARVHRKGFRLPRSRLAKTCGD